MVAALMEYTNYLGRVKESGEASAEAWREAVRTLLLLLAPSAPHLAEELWQRCGCEYSIHNQPWPAWDESLVAREEFTLVIQVNGRVRDRLTVPVSVTEEEAKKLAMEQEKVKTHLEGRQTVKAIYVPGKLVNIVVK
jgi:leucyl-tRNA synthetase